jgi:heavy metal translocating P-type ATPase
LVLSGAVNGESALTIRADKPAHDSRHAKIMQVMRESERRRPRIRRLGDQLGALYTPFSVGIALLAWFLSGDVTRFLAVLVVATPCPLLIAIPVATIGSISLAARRGIIIRDPVVLEQVERCRVAVFDKTGTLTHGRPDLIGIVPATGVDELQALSYVACLERYSKHPLASAVLRTAEQRHLVPLEASHVSEHPGQGLVGTVSGHRIRITGRKQWLAAHPNDADLLPPVVAGMECIVAVDDVYTATLRFRDQPRDESRGFIAHLSPEHHVDRVLLVSGDREAEVEHLAQVVGIREVYFGQSPEQKVDLVRRVASVQPTLFVGDGINDAPALRAATVGVAMGTNNDVTTDAAGAVVLESSIVKIDELLHIGSHFRSVALQSAVGGMVCSMAGMAIAAVGYLPPVGGALFQEFIDVIAVLNALRATVLPKR